MCWIKRGGFYTSLFAIDSLPLSVSNNVLPKMAATTPPAMGAKMNTYSCDKASPPAKRAGPKLRAGLTEVPVNGMPSK